MEQIGKALLILISLVFLTIICAAVWADGPVYEVGVDTTTNVSCTNATERENGTALNLNEIKKVECAMTQDAIGTTGENFYMTMPGGCQTTPFDLTLLSPGQWYKVCWTVACDGDCAGIGAGTERYSAASAHVPFEYKIVNYSPPKPPVITE